MGQFFKQNCYLQPLHLFSSSGLTQSLRYSLCCLTQQHTAVLELH